MQGESIPPEAAFAERFLALGNPVRIALLKELRTPRTLGEIRVPAASRKPRGLAPGRVLTRQSVRHHLDVLLAAGFVTARERVRGSVVSEEYVVNHRRLFAVSEEVREFARYRAEDVKDSTMPLAHAAVAGRAPHASALVVVHGVENGLAFPLGTPGAAAREGSWVVGRGAHVDVDLDHDPFVSAENARLVRDAEGAFWLQDTPGSRNGTHVNWKPLAPGETVRMRHGDVVGVGRTLLILRE